MNAGRTKTGKPTLAESGGADTKKTGNATVICGEYGEQVKPHLIPRGYSNGCHAIFTVKPGMHVIIAARNNGGETATVYRIDAIGTPANPDEVITAQLGTYENGSYSQALDRMFTNAIDAAIDKARCYHCRQPHYRA